MPLSRLLTRHASRVTLRRLSLALPLALGMALVASFASAGHWIVPVWPEGRRPPLAPVHLYWFQVSECPLIYRTEVDVPEETDHATAFLRTSGHAYVCVDGRQVYGWAPQAKDKDRPAIPADPKRVHEIDFTPFLTPGRHVLTVSAPAEGFVLDGGLYAGAKRLAPLTSRNGWSTTQFPPTTVVEDQPLMRLDYKDDAPRVREAPEPGGGGTLDEREPWVVGEDALAKSFYQASAQRFRRELDDVLWRLALMAKKGIYIVGGAAYGSGGPLRMDARALKRATTALGAAEALSSAAKAMEGAKVETVADLVSALPASASAWRMLRTARAEAEEASRQAFATDEHKALALAAAAVGTKLSPEDAMAPPATLRERVQDRLGHPLNHLNESRYDRLGWINHPELVDSDLGRWGIRINPVDGPTRVTAPRQCFFSTDPDNTGMKDLRWSVGYNIENQWPRIDATRSWTEDQRFADHKGIAWYRTRIHVPSEWVGNEMRIKFQMAGIERTWFNEAEVTKLGNFEGERVYNLPAKMVSFGGDNFLAFRVEASGEKRGPTSPIEASCPALEAPQEQHPPRADVLATPLSPCVVLTAWKDSLRFYHAGKAELILPGQVKPGPCAYDPAKNGRLKANWALLWLEPNTLTSPTRPILLVFRRQPLSIEGREGLTTLRFSRPGERVIAVRPWAKALPSDPQVALELDEKVAFWSRAALAVPIDYMSVTRVAEPGESIGTISVDSVPRGPVLSHTIVYDYLETRYDPARNKDEWDIEPLKTAPLPALCSYAVDCTFRNLKLEGEAGTLQDGGLLAPYRGVRNADRVSYSYDVEPYPRFAGFTSWMFSDADTGVLGNLRELELIAATGANSYRPQHNFSDEMPPPNLDPGGGRTRVQAIADYCKDLGLNYMNNIDQTLGRKQEFVRENYEEFMKLVGGHYEKIARQLADRPFWAVAYDLINEPFDHKHDRYNPAMKALTARVRGIDKTHLCYVEPCEAWGAIQQLRLIELTGDPLTVYSFHDYNFRLNKLEDRWPTLERDITNIYRMWLPAIEFQIKHGVCMHCGEFGGHHRPTDDSIAQTLLMNDFFRIFDQFGMHHHYYSGRDVYQRLGDGSIRPSNVIHAYRAYFARPDFNAHYKRWPGQPEPSKLP